MKTVIKLVIGVALINAALRSGLAAWKYYQLKDEAQQVILFGSATPTEQLRSEILDKAEELDLPLEPDDVDVQRDGDRTVAFASYVQPIELLPMYTYPADLSFTVEGLKSAPTGAPLAKP
jgi:hypothetical protein